MSVYLVQEQRIEDTMIMRVMKILFDTATPSWETIHVTVVPPVVS